MNVTEITKVIHNKINTATSLEEILLLSKAMEKISLGNVKIVSTFADLNNFFPRFGEIFFVEDENKIYYGYGSEWISLVEETTLNILYSNGENISGNLGIGVSGSVFNKSSPVSVSSAVSDWVHVNLGYFSIAAVRANGEAYMWGRADNGILGNEREGFDIYPLPAPIVGGFTDWVKVNVGGNSSVGLKSDGTLWTWGRNFNGLLGDNGFLNKSSPATISGGISDWTDVSVFDRHVLALRSDGTAWGWGSGFDGGIGDGSNTNRSSPVSVVGGFTDWIQVSAGGRHSLGVRANGTAWSWGYNGSSFSGSGPLGDGTTTSKNSPVSVVGGFTDWVQVSSGSFTSLGIRANGTAWAWGRNRRFGSACGQLGDGTTTDKSSPVSVVGGFTDWVQVASGEFHTVGLRSNGTAWSWGHNGAGQLGDETTVSKSSPVSIVGGFTDWSFVAANKNTTHLIRSF